jgi:hypothetical protein
MLIKNCDELVNLNVPVLIGVSFLEHRRDFFHTGIFLKASVQAFLELVHTDNTIAVQVEQTEGFWKCGLVTFPEEGVKGGLQLGRVLWGYCLLGHLFMTLKASANKHWDLIP